VGDNGEPAQVDPGLRDDGERKRTIGYTLYAVGGAAVLTGAVLLLLNQPQPVYEPAPRVGFLFDGRFAGVRVAF
jgi:hypothetical protein